MISVHFSASVRSEENSIQSNSDDGNSNTNQSTPAENSSVASIEKGKITMISMGRGSSPTLLFLLY